MDMDLDLLDFDSDRIQEFLENKLEQIQSSNTNLEKVIQNRKEQTVTLRENWAGKCPPSSVIQLGEVWKRINNNKYILGVSISNTSDTTLRDPVVFSELTPDTPLLYKSLLLTDDEDEDGRVFKWVSTLKLSGYLVIVTDVPQFVDHLEYTFSASVAFHIDGNDAKVQVDLPPVKLSSEDFADNVVPVAMYKAIEGRLADLLALLVSNERYEFNVLFSSHWDRSLDNTLETYCGLRRVALNKSPAKKFFLVHNISAIIDGSLLEVIAGNKLDIHTKNDQSARFLLHHLHRHLINVAVIPKSFYQRYLFEKFPDEPEELRKLLLKEHEFLRDNNPTRDSFRLDLAELEHDTNLFMLRINEITKYKGEINSQLYN